MGVNSELLFRVLFSGLWLAFLANVMWVNYAAKWVSSRRTSTNQRRLRTVAVAISGLYFAGTMLYALVPAWIMFVSIQLPDWFRLVMVAGATLSVLCVSWAIRALGKNWAPSVSGVRKDTVLVTSGPYAYVRHPIYSGVFFFLVTVALVAANLFILIPTLALIALLYRSIAEEETLLIARFGNEYREYMKRTPRLIPRFSFGPAHSRQPPA